MKKKKLVILTGAGMSAESGISTFRDSNGLLEQYNVEDAIDVMNYFMEHSRYHYSSYYVRFNEGNMVRYRYASCKENREGFYCDVVIR